MTNNVGLPSQTDEDTQNQNYQNQSTTSQKSGVQLEAPHVYSKEAGFAAAGAQRNKLKAKRRPSLFKNATKKQKVLGSVLAAVLLIGGTTGVYALNNGFKTKNQPAPPVAQQAAAPAPAPTTEAGKLTGAQISPELNKRPVTGIMIENSPDARPQAALKDAGVVFEAIAEGGITRFLALYQESQPDYIGPVRSVRPYYAELLAPFDASIVHAGGSADGLAKVKALGLKDIDHGANGGAFQRVNDRYAPHNLYTNMGSLDKVNSERGYNTSNAKSFVRKTEKPGQAVTAGKIDINMSAALYNSHYDYDPASNTYKRSQAGKPHSDHRSGQQIAPKVVVALVMNYSTRGIYSVYQTTGSGKAYIFQDGTVQAVTWTKANEREQIAFTDEAGKPVGINPGQTWLALVKDNGSVSYTP